MSVLLAGLTLPDLLWSDESDWRAVAASERRTIGGKKIIQESAVLAGRPVTLSDDSAWLSRADLLALMALADAPGWTGPLTLRDGRTMQVRFRSGEEAAVEAKPLFGYVDAVDEDLYVLTNLRLETV